MCRPPLDPVQWCVKDGVWWGGSLWSAPPEAFTTGTDTFHPNLPLTWESATLGRRAYSLVLSCLMALAVCILCTGNLKQPLSKFQRSTTQTARVITSASFRARKIPIFRLFCGSEYHQIWVFSCTEWCRGDHSCCLCSRALKLGEWLLHVACTQYANC